MMIVDFEKYSRYTEEEPETASQLLRQRAPDLLSATFQRNGDAGRPFASCGGGVSPQRVGKNQIP